MLQYKPKIIIYLKQWTSSNENLNLYYSLQSEEADMQNL